MGIFQTNIVKNNQVDPSTWMPIEASSMREAAMLRFVYEYGEKEQEAPFPVKVRVRHPDAGKLQGALKTPIQSKSYEFTFEKHNPQQPKDRSLLKIGRGNQPEQPPSQSIPDDDFDFNAQDHFDF